MSDSDQAKAEYVANLPGEVHDAAMRIHLRMSGILASDIWSDHRGYLDAEKEDADYRLLAKYRDDLGNGPNDWTDQDKAEIWVREFIPWILRAKRVK